MIKAEAIENQKEIKNTFLWPLLAGGITYGLKGPSQITIIFVLLLALYIFVIASEKEKYFVCAAVLIFQFINAFFVFSAPNDLSSPLFSTPNLWIANRLLYVVGLTLFFPPLIVPFVTKEWRKTVGIVGAMFAILVGLWAFNDDREKKYEKPVECERLINNECVIKKKPEPWYSPVTLIDDVCMGLAAGLLSVLLLGDRKKTDDDTSHTNSGQTSGTAILDVVNNQTKGQLVEKEWSITASVSKPTTRQTFANSVLLGLFTALLIATIKRSSRSGNKATRVGPDRLQGGSRD